jgi:dTDP-4-dehydrorhamnose reductase
VSGPRILVLGASGMLGHKMFQMLGTRFADVWCTLREPRSDAPWNRIELFDSERVLSDVDAARIGPLESLLRELRPDILVNCVGIVKQRATAAEAIASITVNSLLPHRLAACLAEWSARLIHFSTDCVFNGRRGRYSESDPPDAEDLYGRTKALGEVFDHHALTIRTSIIGRELRNHRSLLEWFRSHDGHAVSGYRNVWWSGITTNHLAGIISDLIARNMPLSGAYQISSGRISKYDLLRLIAERHGLDVRIEPRDTPVLDRSLRGERFERDAGYTFPGWEALLDEIADDPTPYERWAEPHTIVQTR